MNLKRRNEGGNHSANHLPLPVFEPPNTPHEFSEMWFDILRKRREEIPMQVKDGNLLTYLWLTIFIGEVLKAINKDCHVFALMNALYGNSFIDLAKYMKRPSSLSTRIISKFKNRNNEEEIKCRNHLISNFLKYATEANIKLYTVNTG